MKDNISPEEKLLKLIRGKGKRKPQDSAIGKEPSHSEIKSKIITKTNTRLSERFSIISLASSFSARKIVIILLICSCVFLIATFVHPLFGFKILKSSQPFTAALDQPNLKLKRESKPFESYLKDINNRNIFASAPATLSAGPASASAGLDSISDINLVGIISGESPQAIIEDKKTNKTFYVSKGESMGEILVEDILDGRVIINFKGKRFELHL